MRAAFKAIAEHLQEALEEMDGELVTVYRDYAYGVAAPYVVLQAPSLSHHGDEPVGGPQSDESGGTFTATSVHSTTDGARWVADRVRSVLSPGLAVHRVPADDLFVETVWVGGLGQVVVDRDVRLPDSNTYPAVAIEEYVFTAQPGGDES